MGVIVKQIIGGKYFIGEDEWSNCLAENIETVALLYSWPPSLSSLSYNALDIFGPKMKSLL